MKAQDLRIGNWVTVIESEYDEDDNVKEWTSHDEKINSIPNQLEADYTFGVNCDIMESDIVRVEPIPLTEEWLVKFGRVKNKENPTWNYLDIRDGWALILKYNEKRGCWVSLHNSYMPELKYVHQLQNLYHALTGEELEIKEVVT